MCQLHLKVKMCPIFKGECDDGRLFSAVCIKCFVLLWTNRVLLSPVMKQATVSSSSSSSPSERRQRNKAFSVLTWRCWDVQCWRREESVSEHTHTHPLPLTSHAECCRALLSSSSLFQIWLRSQGGCHGNHFTEAMGAPDLGAKGALWIAENKSLLCRIVLQSAHTHTHRQTGSWDTVVVNSDVTDCSVG